MLLQTSTSRPNLSNSSSPTSDNLTDVWSERFETSNTDTTSDWSRQPSPIASLSAKSGATVTLPTPFWPVSLQCQAQTVCVRSPSLPTSFPAIPEDCTPTDTAAEDINTPDTWIRRNPELIRLTGKHPFNVEARLSDLFDFGFITPSHLHFVRNHGAVPHFPSPSMFSLPKDDTTAPSLVGLTESAKISLQNCLPSLHCDDRPGVYAHWTVKVHGLVTRPTTFTIKELAETFQVVTLPVTVVCAGNRRKEQNVIRKSLGFDWGAAGVSTALWTGVYLSDVLQHVDPIRPSAKHVIFEGADELPKGPYGTSQKLTWAADRTRGMLLAWAMNGLPLEPDHGFPIRLIVPGQIGGRMVKWLTRVEISDVESNHHLHYWDNKVLPMQLSPEQARDEPQWWYDPRYIITAIAYPAHGETITVPSKITDSYMECGAYVARGYAYAGGGRRITRVELSWDDGCSWHLADIEYPEDQFRRAKYEHPIYGLLDLTESESCFCWCFWTLRLSHATLLKANSLTVRAMDESMNTQPRDMYLNATSMMNNWWFRITIRKTLIANGSELYFEHPTVVGTSRPGWMTRMKAEGLNVLQPNFAPNANAEQSSELQSTLTPVSSKPSVMTMTRDDVHRKITAEEFREQGKNQDWFVVGGAVYNANKYLKEHPGGADSILLASGDDATDDFMTIHSDDAKRKLAEFHIGTLVGNLAVLPLPPKVATTVANVFLDPGIWKLVTLSDIQAVNHDSFIYRFSLPLSDGKLGLPVGQHVYVRLRRKDTQELVQRAYTPVSKADDCSTMDILIKLYRPCDEYPKGGKMSGGFDQLRIGDTIDVKGPLGSFVWEGAGQISWKGVFRNVTEVGLICGGSGITPILQVIRRVLHDPEESTKLWLISSNKTEADILCREELDGLLHFHKMSGRFRLHYTLGRPPEGWTHGQGRITQEMLAHHLPRPGAGKMVLACGPLGMVEGVVRDGLSNLGWDVDKDLVIF